MSDLSTENLDALATPISRLMTPRVLTVSPSALVSTLAVQMEARDVGCVVVIGPDGAIVGIFTERDLLNRVVAAGLNPATTAVGKVMTARVTVFPADMTIAAASQVIERNGLRHLPIASAGKLVGILSMRDIFKLRLRHLESVREREAGQIQELRRLLMVDGTEQTRILMALNERLQALSVVDDLTGLFNYRYFMERLTDELSRATRYEFPLGIVMVDIDHFKSVNDRYGHRAGDVVLRGVAAVLMGSAEGGSGVVRLRRTDVVARYGGEEFALLMPYTRAEAAALVAERVRIALSEATFTLGGGHEVKVTASFGVAASPDHGDDVEALIRLADESLYAAKNKGRNQVCVAAPMRSARRPGREDDGNSADCSSSSSIRVA